jgi:hypothetical protein
MLDSHFGSRREGFFGRVPPLSKNQGADEPVITDRRRELTGDRSGGVQLIICQDVHATRNRVPEDHAVGVIASADGEANAALDVKIPLFDAGVRNQAIIADAPLFEELW